MIESSDRSYDTGGPDQHIMTVDSGGGTEDPAWSLTSIEVLGAEIQEFVTHGEKFGNNEWTKLVDSFEQWGELPRVVEKVEWNGNTVTIETKSSGYVGEAIKHPFSSMRALARSEGDDVEWPIGGLSSDGLDLLLIWPLEKERINADEVLRSHLSSGDLESAEALLTRCASALGSAHEALSSVWSGPPNSKSWNSLLAKMEERIDSRTLWRAPFKPGMNTILSFGNMPIKCFSESSDGKIRIRPTSSGQINAVAKSKGIEWPAIRDLASLLRDLSRISEGKIDDLVKTSLRAVIISSWVSVQGKLRTDGTRPRRSLEIIGGGLAIWEYEQALSSNIPRDGAGTQSSRHSNKILSRVSSIQRRLFTIRIFSLLSIIGLFGGSICLVAGTYDPDQLSPFVGIFALILSLGMRLLYFAMAPRPETVFS